MSPYLYLSIQDSTEKCPVLLIICFSVSAQRLKRTWYRNFESHWSAVLSCLLWQMLYLYTSCLEQCSTSSVAYGKNHISPRIYILFTFPCPVLDRWFERARHWERSNAFYSDVLRQKKKRNNYYLLLQSVLEEISWAEVGWIQVRSGKNTRSNFKSWQNALGNFCALMSSMHFWRLWVCCLSCSRSVWMLVSSVLLKTTPTVVRVPELMASGWTHAFTSGLKSLTVTLTLLFHFLLTEHRAEMDAFTGPVTCKALEGVPRNKHGDFSFYLTDLSESQLLPNPLGIFCG